MKPKQHTNYFNFPKKLKRMRKYVPKSKRTGSILSDYRNNYFTIKTQLWFYKNLYDILKKAMLSNILMGNS